MPLYLGWLTRFKQQYNLTNLNMPGDSPRKSPTPILFNKVSDCSTVLDKVSLACRDWVYQQRSLNMPVTEEMFAAKVGNY